MFHCQQSGMSFPHIMSSGSSHRPLLACSGGHGGGLPQPPCWAKHSQYWWCTQQRGLLQAQSKNDFFLQRGLENQVEGRKAQHPQRSCQGGEKHALPLTWPSSEQTWRRAYHDMLPRDSFYTRNLLFLQPAEQPRSFHLASCLLNHYLCMSSFP